MTINPIARRPKCAFTAAMTRSTRAFSLFEALAMIVTLCVFGWLCVGIVRHDIKHEGKDEREDIIFTTSDKDTPKPSAAPQAPAPATKPAMPWKDMIPPAPASTSPLAPVPIPGPGPAPAPTASPAPASQPAGSSAPVPAKP